MHSYTYVAIAIALVEVKSYQIKHWLGHSYTYIHAYS